MNRIHLSSFEQRVLDNIWEHHGQASHFSKKIEDQLCAKIIRQDVESWGCFGWVIRIFFSGSIASDVKKALNKIAQFNAARNLQPEAPSNQLKTKYRQIVSEMPATTTGDFSEELRLIQSDQSTYQRLKSVGFSDKQIVYLFRMMRTELADQSDEFRHKDLVSRIKSAAPFILQRVFHIEDSYKEIAIEFDPLTCPFHALRKDDYLKTLTGKDRVEWIQKQYPMIYNKLKINDDSQDFKSFIDHLESSLSSEVKNELQKLANLDEIDAAGTISILRDMIQDFKTKCPNYHAFLSQMFLSEQGMRQYLFKRHRASFGVLPASRASRKYKQSTAPRPPAAAPLKPVAEVAVEEVPVRSAKESTYNSSESKGMLRAILYSLFEVNDMEIAQTICEKLIPPNMESLQMREHEDRGITDFTFRFSGEQFAVIGPKGKAYFTKSFGGGWLSGMAVSAGVNSLTIHAKNIISGTVDQTKKTITFHLGQITGNLPVVGPRTLTSIVYNPQSETDKLTVTLGPISNPSGIQQSWSSEAFLQTFEDLEWKEDAGSSIREMAQKLESDDIKSPTS